MSGGADFFAQDAIPEFMKRQCDPNNPCVYLCGGC